MAKIKSNLVCNGVDYSKKSKDRTYYLPLEMTGGVKIYVSYELGMKLKDIIDKEKQYHDKITKCLIPGKKGKLIVCEHNCEKCPFRYDPDDPELSKNPSPLDYDQFQQRLPLTFGELTDEEGNEFEPASDEDFVTDIYYQERKEKMWSEIHSLNEKEQAILDMWSRGVPVRDIANELKMSKSSVDREVKRIIQVLQEKCRGF